MTHVSSPVGNEISCVMFFSQENNPLGDHPQLEKILLDALNIEGFTILGTLPFDFPGHGFSLNVLLGESHAAIHTYPEFNSMYFNLYSCRGPSDGRKTFEHVRDSLKPVSIEDYFERRVVVQQGYDPSTDPRLKESGGT